jgi:hypothetical protein
MDISEERTNTGLRLRVKTVNKLDEAAARLCVSRAAVVEALVWSYADRLRSNQPTLPTDSRGKRGLGRRNKSSTGRPQ